MADIMTADARVRRPVTVVGTTTAPVAAPAQVAAASAAPSAASAPEALPPGAIVIARADFDRALGDFAGLAAAVHASFSASGVTIESVRDGSIFQRAGLRGGDVVTTVDGVKLKSLDDAANLYARAATAKAATVQIVRSGKPVTLHLVIQ